MLKSGQTNWFRLSDAPTFEPSKEQFKDPMVYLTSLIHELEKSGIIKIRPPSDWNPPFSKGDIKFTPRIQKLNELGACSRSRLAYQRELEEFWRLRGEPLETIPSIDDKEVNLQLLRRLVAEKGGTAFVDRHWSEIAVSMGYSCYKGRVIRTIYEKVILPHESVISLASPTSEKPRVKKKVFSRRRKSQLKYCNKCNKSNGSLIVCGSCFNCFHEVCMGLSHVPDDDWKCSDCISFLTKAAGESAIINYGFPHANKTYTLQDFGVFADKFKNNHFGSCKVNERDVEKEFWRLVEGTNEDVSVLYGVEVEGSGFPDEGEYSENPWNLTQLPYKSLMRNLTTEISGMSNPWMYIGMCFSAFCWHVEDQWAPSISYLHWGSTKTWYGIPPSHASDVEMLMRKLAPEIFTASPDLLHHLVTTLSPLDIINAGIPIVRADQHEREFIVTAPRAYHAGFSHGFNFAEAANWLPASWLPIGRSALQQYKQINRPVVFSQDQLVINTVKSIPEDLDEMSARRLFDELKFLLDEETKLRSEWVGRIKSLSVNEDIPLQADGNESDCEDLRSDNLSVDVKTDVKPEIETLVSVKDETDSQESTNNSSVSGSQNVETTVSAKGVDVSEESTSNSSVTDSQNVKSAVLELNVKTELDSFGEFMDLNSIGEEHRQCAKCNAVVFLSCQKCAGCGKLICVDHLASCCGAQRLCFCLKLEEIAELYLVIRSRVEQFDRWYEEADELLSGRALYTTTEARALSSHLKGEVVNRLINAAEEAEQASILANQLIAKKHRTRHRISGCNHVNLEILQQFQERVSKIVCYVPEIKAVDVLVAQYKNLYERIDDLTSKPLSAELFSVAEQIFNEAELLLETVPVNLRTMMDEIKWLRNINEAVRLEDYVQLLNKKPESSRLQEKFDELVKLIKEGTVMESRIKLIMSGKNKYSISDLEILVENANMLPLELSSVDTLSQSLVRAEEWRTRAQQLLTGVPCIESMVSLANKGSALPAYLEELASVRAIVNAAEEWKRNVTRLFRKKNNNSSLLSLLTPRRKRDEVWTNESIGPQEVAKLYKAATTNELIDIKRVRSSPDTGKYCICRKGFSGFMLQCELCHDWFHSSCVTLPRAVGCARSEALRGLHFLCPLCCRSRRPKLAQVFPLLLALEDIPARIGEGEALQCLVERALYWQRSARKLIDSCRISWLLEEEPVRPVLLNCSKDEAEVERTKPTDTSSLRRFICEERRVELYQYQLDLLENTLIDGDLLELTLDECRVIWTVLQAAQDSEDDSPPLLATVSSSKDKETTTNESVKKAKKRRNSDRRQHLKVRLPAFSMHDSRHDNRLILDDSDDNEPSPPQRIRPSIKPSQRTIKRRRPRKSVNIHNISSDDSGSDDERCAHHACRNPKGRDIGWVQCDICERWYHLQCVGITSQVAETQDYICSVCKKSSSLNRLENLPQDVRLAAECLSELAGPT